MDPIARRTNQRLWGRHFVCICSRRINIISATNEDLFFSGIDVKNNSKCYGQILMKLSGNVDSGTGICANKDTYVKNYYWVDKSG